MNNENNFDPFDEVIKGLSSPLGGHMSLNLDDEEDTLKTTTDLSKKDDDEFDSGREEETEEESEGEETEENEGEEEEEDKQPKKKVETEAKPKPKDAGKEETETDFGEYESDIATFVASKLSEKLGEDLGDFDNVDSIIDKLAEIVEENSTPEYANEDVEKLDKFIRDGGSVKQFYEELYERDLNVDDLDLENEADQKRVVKENLRNSGYNDTQIKKKVERYEETGVLQEEAEEAAELVKEFRLKKEKKLLEKQKNFHTEQQKAQQKFVSDVQSTIKELKDIAGIPVSDLEKSKLLKDALVVGKDGKTAYQREYEKDFINQFIISAFFTMNKQTLLGRAEKKGASKLAQELQQKFAQKGKRTKKSINQGGSDDIDALEAFSKQLRRS